jgi:hypothetical protein
MRDGVCTHCGKREVRVSPEKLANQSGGWLAVSTFRKVRVRTYCCTACGAVETWVDDPEGRARIAEKWERPG